MIFFVAMRSSVFNMLTTMIKAVCATASIKASKNHDFSTVFNDGSDLGSGPGGGGSNPLAPIRQRPGSDYSESGCSVFNALQRTEKTVIVGLDCPAHIQLPG